MTIDETIKELQTLKTTYGGECELRLYNGSGRTWYSFNEIHKVFIGDEDALYYTGVVVITKTTRKIKEKD